MTAELAVAAGVVLPPAPRQRLVRGVLFMLGSAALVAAMEAAVRGVSQTLHPFIIMFWREVASVAILLPLWLAAGRPGIPRRRMPLHAVRAVLNGFAIASWYYALRETPLAEASAIVFTSILFAVAGSALMLGERVRAAQWAAIAVGFVGALMIVGPRFDLAGAARFGALVALGSAALFGASMLVGKLTVRGEGSIVSALSLAVGMAAVAFGLALPQWAWPTWADVPFLIAFGFCNVGGQVFFLEALRSAPSSVVIPLDVTRLVFALIFGAALYAEWPGPLALAGAVLVGASSVAVVLGARR